MAPDAEDDVPHFPDVPRHCGGVSAGCCLAALRRIQFIDRPEGHSDDSVCSWRGRWEVAEGAGGDGGNGSFPSRIALSPPTSKLARLIRIRQKGTDGKEKGEGCSRAVECYAEASRRKSGEPQS